MTNAKFQSLVKRLEVLARRHSKGYQSLVGAIALLSYAYMVAIAVSLIDGYYWGFLGIIQSTRSNIGTAIKFWRCWINV